MADKKDRFAGTILEVATLPEYITVGKGKKKRKLPKKTATLTEEQALEIIAKVKSGRTQSSVAAEYGVKQPHVSHIMSGRRFPHLKRD